MKIAIIIIASLAVAAFAMPKKEKISDNSEKSLEDKPLKTETDAADKLAKEAKPDKETKPAKDSMDPENKPSIISKPDTFNGKVGPVTTLDNDFSGSRIARELVNADLNNQRFTVRTRDGNIVHLANTQ